MRLRQPDALFLVAEALSRQLIQQLEHVALINGSSSRSSLLYRELLGYERC